MKWLIDKTRQNERLFFNNYFRIGVEMNIKGTKGTEES